MFIFTGLTPPLLIGFGVRHNRLGVYLQRERVTKWLSLTNGIALWRGAEVIDSNGDKS